MWFYYNCCNVILPNNPAKISDFLKKAYLDYFGSKLGDQDKQFAPHVSCKTCGEKLRDWRNGKKKSLPFVIPMVRRKGKDLITDCYFWMINPKWIPDNPSVIRPIPHRPDLPVPESNGNMEYSSDSEHSDMTVVTGDDAYISENDDQPLPLTQAELNNLTRDLNLWKISAQLLSPRLKEKSLWAPRTRLYWYWNRKREN